MGFSVPTTRAQSLSSVASSRRKGRQSLDKVVCDLSLDTTLDTVSELKLSSMDPQIAIPILEARLELLSQIHAIPLAPRVKSAPPHSSAATASQEPEPSTSTPGPSTAAGIESAPPCIVPTSLPRTARRYYICSLMMSSSSYHMAVDTCWWSSVCMCVL